MSSLTTQRIIDNALRLGLGHTAESVTESAARADSAQMGYLDFVDHLLAEEVAVRESRRFRNALKLSGLPHHKTLDDFDYTFQPGLETRRVRDLATLEFLTGAGNIAILGPPGVGKTHIAIGLAVAACQAGKSIYFTTLDDLVRKLKAADAANRLPRQPHAAIAVGDRRSRVPRPRPRRSQHVFPADQPQIRKRLHDHHEQQALHRVGNSPR